MADRWTLVTPSGVLLLNSSFSAPRLHPGGVDTNAALRRDARNNTQRTGDGLRTPGPLTLRGRVWRDDQDVPAIVDELNDIQDAVASTIEVRRQNDTGTFTYSSLAGGPPPAITPDGLGGWVVEIELWPGRAEPTFIPISRDTFVYVFIDGSMEEVGPTLIATMNDVRDLLADSVYGDIADNRFFIESTSAPDVQDAERFLRFAAQPTEPDVVALLMFNEASPRYHAVPRVTANEPTSYFTADFQAWKTQHDTRLRRHLSLYAIDSGEDADYTAFKAFILDAFSGLNGYPTNPRLSDLGATFQVDVQASRTAEEFLQDVITLLGG
jgi:hypothetical protein